MIALAAFLALQSAAMPLPTGQIVLGKQEVRAGDAVPALLVLSAPDTLAALAVSGTLVALPASRLWWRGAERGCGRPPGNARAALEWSSTVRGDEPLAFCVQAAATGMLRVAAAIRVLQPDGSWRTRSLVSEAATAAEPSAVSSDVRGALLGFVFGLAGSLIQLWRQQKGERDKKQQEFEQDRATRRMEMEKKVFASLTTEVQKNAAALHGWIATPPWGGEPPQLLLTGMQAVLADPDLAAYLKDGDGRAYGERMRAVYGIMSRFNRSVRTAPDAQAVRALAEEAHNEIDAALKP